MINTVAPSQTKDIVCIICPNGCRIHCEQTQAGVQYSGQKCKRGVEYATAELSHPMRTLTTSVKTVFPEAPVISVRTDGEIEKAKLIDVAKALAKVIVNQRVKIGDIIAQNVCGTGVNIICTSDRLVHHY